MIKLIIADDHKLIREGLRKLCEKEIDLEVVAETDRAENLESLIKQHEPDILILDLKLPDKSGLDILKDIKMIYPLLKVLILSMHPEERFAKRTLKLGASGYISKDSDTSEILKAIRLIQSGRKYVSAELAQDLINEMDSDPQKLPHEKLSDREFQVFCLLAEGKPQVEIAANLSISLSTVNTYRLRIMEKLNLSSIMEIAHYAIRNNLID